MNCLDRKAIGQFTVSLYSGPFPVLKLYEGGDAGIKVLGSFLPFFSIYLCHAAMLVVFFPSGMNCLYRKMFPTTKLQCGCINKWGRWGSG